MTKSKSVTPAWQTDEQRFYRPAEFPARVKLLRWAGKHNWIPRGHDRLLRAIWNPDTCNHFNFEIDFFGKRYRGDLAHYIDWIVFSYGAAPLSELTLLERLAKESKSRAEDITFYDIGANTGHHTLFMSGIADRVYAFEPFLAVRALLEDKISLNKLNNVTVFPVALGDKDIALSYHPAAGGNSGSGSFIEDPNDEYVEPVTLPVRNGDRFFAEMQLPRLDIVKVDVEGFEAPVFRGLAQHIRRDRPAILTEWSENSRKSARSENEFRSLFYEDALFAQVGGRLGRPFQLSTFQYDRASEVLILPSERSSLIRDRLK